MKNSNKIYSYIGTGFLFVSLCVTAESVHAVNAEKVFQGDGNGIVVKGTYVRKGTVAATFHNILALDTLLTSKGSESEINALLKDQRTLSRALYVLDLFEVQPIEGWLSDAKKPGKIMIAVLALQESKELMTDSVRNRLKELAKTSHPIVKAEIRKVIG